MLNLFGIIPNIKKIKRAKITIKNSGKFNISHLSKAQPKYNFFNQLFNTPISDLELTRKQLLQLYPFNKTTSLAYHADTIGMICGGILWGRDL